MPLRPFFCRIGSKRDIASFVMDYFPDEDSYDKYVEPFIGGGAIYWKKKPTAVEVINDLDSGLIRGYRLLKGVKSRDFRKDLNTVEKIQRFVGAPIRSEADKLTAEVIRRCNGFGGREYSGKIYNDSNPFSKLKKIDEYQERMRGTKIENRSYEAVIRAHDGPRTFFYLDPPYEKSEGLYTHGDFDFEKLGDILRKVKGKWLLSINDSPNIRRIFKGFFFKAFTVKPKSNTRMTTMGSKPRKELLISNYGRGE